MKTFYRASYRDNLNIGKEERWYVYMDGRSANSQIHEAQKFNTPEEAAFFLVKQIASKSSDGPTTDLQIEVCFEEKAERII